jgi:phosphomannomutase
LGLITANFLHAKVVATPVTSNSQIEAAGDYRVLRTKVGSPFVIAAMQSAADAGDTEIVGFEANGGTLTGSDFTVAGGTLKALPTRDSFLPAIATLSLLAKAKQPLSRVVADHPLAFAAADRLENFPVETSAALMAHLRASDENLAAFLAPIGSVVSKSDIDGLRATLEDGRIIHLRPSGNAPEMRCYVEAQDEQEASKLLAQGLDLIRRWAAERNS